MECKINVVDPELFRRFSSIIASNPKKVSLPPPLIGSLPLPSTTTRSLREAATIGRGYIQLTPSIRINSNDQSSETQSSFLDSDDDLSESISRHSTPYRIREDVHERNCEASPSSDRLNLKNLNTTNLYQKKVSDNEYMKYYLKILFYYS